MVLLIEYFGSVANIVVSEEKQILNMTDQFDYFYCTDCGIEIDPDYMPDDAINTGTQFFCCFECYDEHREKWG